MGLFVAPSIAEIGADSSENEIQEEVGKQRGPFIGKIVAPLIDHTFSKFSKACTKFIRLGLIRPKIKPDMSRMSFLLRTDECQNVSIPLTEAERLWEAPGFHQDRPTAIFITGWKTTISESNSGPAAKAYNCRNDTNFVLLDAANFIEILYASSALNTELIGEYLAKALLKLNRNYVIDNVHLIGHSLGAQIAGSAGRHFRQLSGGATLSRVTGLDPANPCFYDDAKGIRSGNARFVDIIHTNPGVLGTEKVVGDADFFVNGLKKAYMKGCGLLNINSCSHNRAVDYFAETVYPANTNNFLGKRCDRQEDLEKGRNCHETRTVMGYNASSRDLGIFYVDFNADEPYGPNAHENSFTSSHSQCGACWA
ncbi:phospholipase A1-like [Drosophila subobscura]|uniref:phospholipase A1-like n=1 Tax=Drosophila subobscura TaxID=7241 RepID=UPI00155B188E|nr:phospholipase A1-like [Drosophila subobscura]